GSEPFELFGIATAAWNPGVAGVARTCDAGDANSGTADRTSRVNSRRFNMLVASQMSDDDRRPSRASTVRCVSAAGRRQTAVRAPRAVRTRAESLPGRF